MEGRKHDADAEAGRGEGSRPSVSHIDDTVDHEDLVNERTTLTEEDVRCPNLEQTTLLSATYSVKGVWYGLDVMLTKRLVVPLRSEQAHLSEDRPSHSHDPGLGVLPTGRYAERSLQSDSTSRGRLIKAHAGRLASDP